MTRVSVGQAVVVPCDCVRDETDVLLLLCFCFCFGFCCLGYCYGFGRGFSQSPHLQVQCKKSPRAVCRSCSTL